AAKPTSTTKAASLWNLIFDMSLSVKDGYGFTANLLGASARYGSAQCRVQSAVGAKWRKGVFYIKCEARNSDKK
ncbi:MAG: hypothetical protein LCH86_26490, partial [Proteobacteria bacterium]|nr:hypothetical protein [Pseudomonadota bacterium]